MSFLKISQLGLIGWTVWPLEGVKVDSFLHDFFWCIFPSILNNWLIYYTLYKLLFSLFNLFHSTASQCIK